MKLSPQIHDFVLQHTGATQVLDYQAMQSLWSGYGEIARLQLAGTDASSVVLKQIIIPQNHQHPRGWQSQHSEQRKFQSYQVESYWYQHYASQVTARVPKCLGLQVQPQQFIILMEDLSQDFPVCPEQINLPQLKVCLQWLAQFHAQHLGHSAKGLWSQGCYWHLATRPEEHAAISDPQLKAAASEIDRKLQQARYQTLVHGDAKLANFCFSLDGEQTAAVDFQYIGRGVGVLDVAYFFSSCISEADLKRYQDELLDYYFAQLSQALKQQRSQKLDQVQIAELEAEWRYLYPYAWADFHRFLAGWCPDHWKITPQLQQFSAKVLADLAK